MPDSDPLRAATDFRCRRLDDPGLAYIGRVLGPDTTAGWPEDRIALTALYLRGDLAVARVAVDEAKAGEMVAGAWPVASTRCACVAPRTPSYSRDEAGEPPEFRFAPAVSARSTDHAPPPLTMTIRQRAIISRWNS